MYQQNVFARPTLLQQQQAQQIQCNSPYRRAALQRQLQNLPDHTVSAKLMKLAQEECVLHRLPRKRICI